MKTAVAFTKDTKRASGIMEQINDPPKVVYTLKHDEIAKAVKETDPWGFIVGPGFTEEAANKAVEIATSVKESLVTIIVPTKTIEEGGPSAVVEFLNENWK